ncbi:CLUMA_CG021532, isoform A [Clunio marinus]|uniref:CLUMA_CG021532, isoform A n=1 Tax=Clunio marinus TaxID=568069 RepID=A0A1J1J9A0_9DIPT|nr:CLUMA_CG021532, isoform A [Clunio marinus]
MPKSEDYSHLSFKLTADGIYKPNAGSLPISLIDLNSFVELAEFMYNLNIKGEDDDDDFWLLCGLKL